MSFFDVKGSLAFTQVKECPLKLDPTQRHTFFGTYTQKKIFLKYYDSMNILYYIII